MIGRKVTQAPSRAVPGVREDLRYSDHCPNVGCSGTLYLRVRVKTGTEDVIQWTRTCMACHAEFVVLEERSQEADNRSKRVRGR